MNWKDGYKEGYMAAAKKLLLTIEELDEFMKTIDKEKDGTPSKYNIAYGCCGEVDTHSADCLMRGY